jgi:hypothetical protein
MEVTNMGELFDPVQEASIESFPASDPPAFTPVSGTGTTHSWHDGFSSSVREMFREVDVEAVPLAGNQHLALLDAHEFLATALSHWAGGPRADAGPAVADRLGDLRSELREHRNTMERDGSPAEALRRAHPWLIAQSERLMRHHDVLEVAIAQACREYYRELDGERAAARIHRRLRAITASLGTLLSVERSLLTDQFSEPPALD